MAQQTVAVLFGGRSSEHSISSATAGGVLKSIDRERFAVIPVGLTRDGAFVLEEDRPEKFALDAAKLPEVVDNGTRILWPEAGGDRSLRVVHQDGTVDSLGEVDIVLPILHGAHGEDGTIQGFFDTLDVPYAGGGVIDSAICMDKHFMKVVLAAAGLQVAPGITVTERDWHSDSHAVRERATTLGYPQFIKPARAGSSVGVSQVRGEAEFEDALRLAFAEDHKVLIETAIEGREVEVAILETAEGVKASLPGEIVLTTRDFYDFEGKYLGGDGVDVVCPADLSDEQIRRVQEVGVSAFAAVDGQGLARVDVFVTEAGDIIVNELNTMPGFTPISMFPKCWVASGVSYTELITELLDAGLRR